MKKIILHFDTIIEHSKNIFKKKIKLYGSSWRVLRISSVLDQILIKVKRIKNFQEKGILKINENILEDFLSIINYSIIGLIQLSSKSSLQIDLPYNLTIDYYNNQILKAKKLIIKKNHDYNEVWKDINLSSIIDIILQKIFRMKKMEFDLKKNIYKLEYIEDNFLDIINYSILSLIKIKNIKK